MKLWIVRQRDNSVYLFTHKPTLFCGRWCMNGVNQCYTKFWENRVSADMFPKVTFENSPREVELKLASTGSDRGKRDSIIRGLKQLEHDYMLSYEEEIDWLNKLVEK